MPLVNDQKVLELISYMERVIKHMDADRTPDLESYKRGYRAAFDDVRIYLAGVKE